MKTAAIIENYYLWYRGWRRVTLHILLWILAFLFETIQTKFSFREANSLFLLVTLREIATIIVIYYSFAYYIIPKLLLRAKWLSFLVCLVLAYAFLASSQYFTFLWLRKNGLVPVYIENFVNAFLQYDLVTTLLTPTKMIVSIRHYPTLFFALLVKIVKDFFTSSMQKLNLEKEKIKLEKENIKLELNFLKSQINPHFFFNTLNNIYSLIVDKDELAADIVVRLSDLMRYSLYESNQDKIPLERELHFIKDYVALEKIRHKEHVTINLDIAGQAHSLQIPSLILVTFVENAFKHGVNNTIAASWVSIRIGIQDSQLHFFIQNSKPEKLRHEQIQGGIGIINVRRRLDLLYADAYQLAIRNEAATYTVDLKIQLYEKDPQLRNRGRRATSTRTH